LAAHRAGMRNLHSRNVFKYQGQRLDCVNDLNVLLEEQIPGVGLFPLAGETKALARRPSSQHLYLALQLDKMPMVRGQQFIDPPSPLLQPVWPRELRDGHLPLTEKVAGE